MWGEPTIRLHTMMRYKYHKGNLENGIKEGKEKKDSTMNKSKS